MASWDDTQQAAYRRTGAVPGLHFLLDASGSMERSEGDLIQGYNQVLLHLKTLLSPQTGVETWLFNHESRRVFDGPLYGAPLLSAEVYLVGGGTHLKPAIRQLLTGTTTPGQHVLVVFTDGDDNIRGGGEELATATLLTQRQEAGWLCVYLGAYPQALAQGLACGFHEGNCLVFERYYLAQAFARLKDGMQRFFQAAPDQRRLFLTQGIF